MRISEVAEQLDIAASRIRYYESEGLLGDVPRISGRRSFNRSTVLALKFILLAQAAGFSVEEIKCLMNEYNQQATPQHAWHTLALAKREAIAREIDKLQTMDRILTALIGCKCATMVECVQKYHSDP